MQLAELLSDKPAETAITFSELEWSREGSLVLRFETSPWWGTSSYSGFSLCLEDVCENSLKMCPGDAVSQILLESDSSLLWDYGSTSTIFGNAPLPDPPRFFFEFFQLVKYRLGVPRDPAGYLNWKENFSEWLGFVYSRSYCLLSAPNPIVEGAIELLDVQAAEYAVLPNPIDTVQSNSVEELSVFRLDDSWVIAKGPSTVQLF